MVKENYNYVKYRIKTFYERDLESVSFRKIISILDYIYGLFLLGNSLNHD